MEINDYNLLFDHILSQIGRDEMDRILFNWNDSELSEDNSEIHVYTDCRSYGPGTGGVDLVDKKDFVDWLLSDEPYNKEYYDQDNEWINLISEARKALKIEAK